MEVGSATITAGAKTLPVITVGTKIGIETIGGIGRALETEATAAAPALLVAIEVTRREMRTETEKGKRKETGATTDGARTFGQNRNESAGTGADGRNTTESPRHVASPRRGPDLDSDEHPQLPTRSKPSSAAASTPTAPVSFKVKGRDGSHGPETQQQSTSTRENSQEQQQQQRHHDDGDRHQPRGRFDAEPMDEDEEEDVMVEDDGLDDMAAMMGFGGFGTTKNKKVIGNNVGTVRKEKKTEYRQYMNRQGGFRRPLAPIKTEACICSSTPAPSSPADGPAKLRMIPHNHRHYRSTCTTSPPRHTQHKTLRHRPHTPPTHLHLHHHTHTHTHTPLPLPQPYQHALAPLPQPPLGRGQAALARAPRHYGLAQVGDAEDGGGEKRLSALFQGIEDEGERAGAVSEVEQLLKKQQAMSPFVRLRRRCHGPSKVI
ncbi:hypothetical protein CHGG_07770 [Chaetomium globosum CBS 148.51]|uniref:U4/U6.U5 small nuclear ribonucleoprotein 27kDa protein domain-containing protein n=1 Tax=Chaetomium globosum (strain ATCC 6205 / CBS 148.51 / DSM 1962 / NBRC 6347 / NRRL 1970) TaxID=306901 RepID=Q2GW84_CHAGB|nr:uncharacterized protein CHGG_07770 [Chaetomium globosum CBS 148.51]EAQ86517.1 hypothetical protein CHGG_07770 [Chaetomium globosum CBS 148.51]